MSSGSPAVVLANMAKLKTRDLSSQSAKWPKPDSELTIEVNPCVKVPKHKTKG